MAAIGRRVHALVVGLGLVVASLAITAGVLEVAVRWVDPQDLHRDEGLWAPDPDRAFRLAPGFRGTEVSHEFRIPIAINSRGLRDREIAPTRPPGTARILVVGDSFTYGSGVAAEDTYPKRLERLLAERAGVPVEVINAGVSGYGTAHEAAFLRAEGWAYEPAVVVLQMFPQNDLDENLEPFGREVVDGALRVRAGRGEGPAWLRRGQAVVRARSHAYRFLGDRYHLLRIRLGLEPSHAASLGVYLRRPPARVTAGWDATRAQLREIVAMGRQHGRPVVVVHAPALAALDDERAAAFASFYRVDRTGLDWDRPGRTLGALCAALGVPYLDLTEAFRATGRSRELYYAHNGHWNSAGHDQVARWLLEALVAEKGAWHEAGAGVVGRAPAGAMVRRLQPPTPR
ncbi:MAG TPA: GDSL-type esterase/lipase family protein [Methylomirabilota bacterium]|nr:GDSL-type esterase/lipase family protein [Methylomirabilota bacterium]